MLQTYLYDTYTARKAKAQQHGQRQPRLQQPALIGSHNFYLRSGNRRAGPIIAR